jgi:ferrous iron transport protein B
VDATNIERNLYLTTQLADLGLPIIIGMNMMDVLTQRGDAISFETLEKDIGISVVPISASHSEGLEKLIERAISLKNAQAVKTKNIYTGEVGIALKNIEKILEDFAAKNGSIFKNVVNKTDVSKKRKPIVKFCMYSHIISPKWAAVKIFEDDELTEKSISISQNEWDQIAAFKNLVKTSPNVDRQTIIADQRYKYICDICSRMIQRKQPQVSLTLSDRIDAVLTNRFLAIPLFFCLILCVFAITFGQFGNFFKERGA